MTQEDKAKAYDKALESMRDWITYVPIDDVAKNYILETFPELKKSEDKRIRKALINGFNKLDKSCVWYNGITNGKILAWLEKQGEHYNFRQKIQIGDEVTRNEDGVLVNLSQLNRVAKHADKQCEQKPDDKVEQKEDMCNKLTDFEVSLKHVMEEAIECGDTHNLKADAEILLGMTRKQVKPTWSEEDDTFFKAIIRDIENTKYISEDAKKDRITWPKSLKERVQPQPKQEWSEEDEKAINDIMWIIEAYRKNGFNETHLQIANSSENWLKSLKERYTWKPSDEQMKALHDLNLTGDISYLGQQQILIELYNDLKKLREK